MDSNGPDPMVAGIVTSDEPGAQDATDADVLDAAKNIIFLLVMHAGGAVRIPSRMVQAYFSELAGYQLVQQISPINDDWVCELRKLA